MPVVAIHYWLSRFVLEVKYQDGTDYPPNLLYQICCGLLMRNMKFHDRADINFFSDPAFELNTYLTLFIIHYIVFFDI